MVAIVTGRQFRWDGKVYRFPDFTDLVQSCATLDELQAFSDGCRKNNKWDMTADRVRILQERKAALIEGKA